MEENNRMGKTRDLFKKIRDIKRIFYANFWAPKSLQMVIAAMKLKDAYSLEGKLWPT